MATNERLNEEPLGVPSLKTWKGSLGRTEGGPSIGSQTQGTHVERIAVIGSRTAGRWVSDLGASGKATVKQGHEATPRRSLPPTPLD